MFCNTQLSLGGSAQPPGRGEVTGLSPKGPAGVENKGKLCWGSWGQISGAALFWFLEGRQLLTRGAGPPVVGPTPLIVSLRGFLSENSPRKARVVILCCTNPSFPTYNGQFAAFGSLGFQEPTLTWFPLIRGAQILALCPLVSAHTPLESSSSVIL